MAGEASAVASSVRRSSLMGRVPSAEVSPSIKHVKCGAGQDDDQFNRRRGQLPGQGLSAQPLARRGQNLMHRVRQLVAGQFIRPGPGHRGHVVAGHCLA